MSLASSPPSTLAQKLVARASGRDSVTPGEIVNCRVDLAMFHDSSGPRRLKPMLEELGAQIWDKRRVVLVMDHYLPERDEETDAGFNRCRVLVQFVTRKRIADFRAQGVTGAETGRLDAEGLPRLKQGIPELADQLVAENRKRVEVGAMAPLEARQAESQAASARAALIQAKSNLAIQENVVKQLITDNFAEWANVSLVPTGKLTAPGQTFDLQSSWERGLSQRPEILQAKINAEIQGIQLKFDKNQLFPRLDLYATYGYNGSGNEFSGSLYDVQERNRPFYTYVAQISVPLANWSERNRYKASKATMQQLVLTVKQWERDIMRQIDDDVKVAQASYENVAATRVAREYAEEALAAEQKKLEQGKSTTYTVLQMQRDLTAARGAEIQALDAYNRNLSQLSLDEGTTLDRLGIRFDGK